MASRLARQSKFRGVQIGSVSAIGLRIPGQPNTEAEAKDAALIPVFIEIDESQNSEYWGQRRCRQR